MKRSKLEPTTTGNLEEKFDGGEEVLDYFALEKARVIDLQPASSKIEKKPSAMSVVRENSPLYGKIAPSRGKRA